MLAILKNMKILFSVLFIFICFNDVYCSEEDSDNNPIKEIYFVNLAGNEPFKYQNEERVVKIYSSPADDAQVVADFKIEILADNFEVRTRLLNKESHQEPIYSGLCGEKVLAVYPSAKREGDFYLINLTFLQPAKEYWVKAPSFKITDLKEKSPLNYWYRFSEATFEKAGVGNVQARLIHYGKKKSSLINLSWLYDKILLNSKKLELVCDADATQRQVSPKPAIDKTFEEPFFVEFDERIQNERVKPKFPDGCWDQKGGINYENCRVDENSCKLSKTYILKDDSFFIFDHGKKAVKEKDSKIFSEIYLSDKMRQNIIVKVDKLFIDKRDEAFPFQDLLKLEQGFLTVKDITKFKTLVGEGKPFTLNFQGKCGQLKEREIHQRYQVFTSWKDDRQIVGEIFIGLAEGVNEVAFIDKKFVNHSFAFNFHSGACDQSHRYIHQVEDVKGDWVNLGDGPWGENGWIRKKSYGFFTDFKAGFVWLDHRNSVDFRKKDNHIYAVGDRMIGSAEGEVDSQKFEVPVDYSQLFDGEGFWKIKLFCEYGC